MKKTNRRLVIRRETLCALRVLDNRKLEGAVGAEAQRLLESGTNCPALVVLYDSTRLCPAASVARCG
jgi:hypothetical protein